MPGYSSEDISLAKIVHIDLLEKNELILTVARAEILRAGEGSESTHRELLCVCVSHCMQLCM